MAALRSGYLNIRFWVTFSFFVIFLLVLYYIASDRITPMTRDAYVQAFVVPVTPLVSGEVTEVLVKNGNEVKKGDPLFRIDPRSFQFQVDRLQARLKQVQLDFDQLAGAADEKHAEIEQIKSMLAKANLDLEYTTVLAASDGFVNNMQLNSGVIASAGTAVMTLVDARRWWIVANFEENALSVIQDGQPVEFGLYMFPGKVFAGRVESIGWGVERGQVLAPGNLPQIDNRSRWVSFSQRFQVRIAPSGPIAEQPLRVGASARVVVFSDDESMMNGIARSLLKLSAATDYLY